MDRMKFRDFHADADVDGQGFSVIIYLNSEPLIHAYGPGEPLPGDPGNSGVIYIGKDGPNGKTLRGRVALAPGETRMLRDIDAEIRRQHEASAQPDDDVAEIE